MVKTTKQGKERPFSRGLLLTIVTFGLYGIYWAYKAPRGLFDQFELRREGRDDGVVWLVLGLVFQVLLLVYVWKIVENLEYIRQRMGMSRDLQPITAVMVLVGAVGSQILIYLLALSTGILEIPPDATPTETFDALLPVLLAGAVAQVALFMYLFYRLQTEINEVWDAWNSRLGELTTEAPEGPGGGHPTPDHPQPPGHRADSQANR